MASRYRPRRGFNFALYQDLPMEQVLTDFIVQLKKERKYVTTLKNGLRLMGSLMQRDLSVLDELFPFVREAILASVPKVEPTPSSGDLERMAARAAQLAAQQVVMQMPGLPATTPVAAPLKPSTNTLGKGISFSMPVFEDDDDGDTLVLTKSTKTTNFDNFMASILELDERADREYAENLAAGNIDPRTGRRINAVQPGMD